MNKLDYTCGIPIEPVDSVPRPKELQKAQAAFSRESISLDELEALYDAAVKETVEQFEATGSPAVSDGETKTSFAAWP